MDFGVKEAALFSLEALKYDANKVIDMAEQAVLSKPRHVGGILAMQMLRQTINASEERLQEVMADHTPSEVDEVTGQTFGDLVKIELELLAKIDAKGEEISEALKAMR
jgi:hypothetical protein